jgi:citrate synthase
MGNETKPFYSPGLENVAASESAISFIDPQGKLYYRGYDVAELTTNASFEEVAWLLWHGELPTMTELASLSRQLAAERHLPAAVLHALRLLPPGARAMDCLRTGLSMLASFESELDDRSPEANVRKSARLLAKAGCLVAESWRIAHGQELVPPSTSLNHAGNLLYQLSGEVPDLLCAEVMDTLMVLHADHEFNASTFAARVTASTLADMPAAVTSAVATLKGSLHGGANEQAMKLLREIGSPDRVEAWVKGRLARQEAIPGFGHRVYACTDARVPILRQLAQQLCSRFGQERWVDICTRLEEVMEHEARSYANVDLYAAPVLFLLGVPPELNTAIFACSRMAGWCAHIMEQQSQNQLIRPVSLYRGPERRPYPTNIRCSAA